MATTNITYTDKEQGQVNPLPEIQKMTFGDANEIKNVVNNNATELGLTNTAVGTNTTNIGTNATDIGTNATAILLRLVKANNLSDVASAVTALANLGGLALAGGTMTGAILGSQGIVAYRPVSGTISVDSDLDALSKNETTLVTTVSNSVEITVTDAANADPIGTEYEFIHRTAGNPITFAVAGSQIIISADSMTTLNKRGGAVVLKKCLNNTWYLIGLLS